MSSIESIPDYIDTKREAEVLRAMSAKDEDMIWEGREVYAGKTKTNPAMVYKLLRKMFIRIVYEQYPSAYLEITERGQKALDAYDKST